jgi:hypothetical protein
VRFLPIVATAEVKGVLPQADVHGDTHATPAWAAQPAREGAV